LEFLRELVESMTQEGQAEWMSKNQRGQALLYWHKPEEWANIIANWVYLRCMLLMKIDETGQKNTVMTLYELSQGDLTTKEGVLGYECTDGRILSDGSSYTAQGVTDHVQERTGYVVQNTRWRGDWCEVLCIIVRQSPSSVVTAIFSLLSTYEGTEVNVYELVWRVRKQVLGLERSLSFRLVRVAS
jgi:ESCRT-II complex subunit